MWRRTRPSCNSQACTTTCFGSGRRCRRMRLRSILFWLHLPLGVLAGAVILIMSVTGVLLTYQRQITAWADTRGYRVEPAAQRLSADTLIAKLNESSPDLKPTALMIRSE